MRVSKFIAFALSGTILTAAHAENAITPVATTAAIAAASQVPVESVAPGKGRIATAVFGQLPSMRQPRLSPDGNKIVYKVAINGQSALAVISLAEPGKPKIFARGDDFTKEAGDRSVGGFRWVGNDHVVFDLASRDIFNGQRADVGRLVSYNVNSGAMQTLAWENASGNASSILDIDHDKGTLLVQRQTTLYGNERMFKFEVIDIDVASGKFSTVQRVNPEVGNWFADSNGLVRGGSAYDGDTGKEKMYYRSEASQPVKNIMTSIDKDFVDARIEPELFLPEKDMAIVTSNKDGFKKAYMMNMLEQKLGEPVFDIAGYDMGSVVTNYEGDKLYGFSYTDTRSRIKWTDPRMADIQMMLDETFGESNATISSRSRDENKLTIAVAETNQVGGHYLYDVKSGKIQLLGWVDPNFRDINLNPVKSIRFKASDGEEIEAVLTMPRHRADAKNLPFVMITHGGPYGPRDSEGFDDWAQAIAELGYVVIQPNYRGSGGYGKDWVKKGRDQGFGTRMQDDLNDAMDHLAAQGMIDPKRACMMGWSYGGYASARAAQRDPDRWRCTIAGAGVYDLQMMKEYDVGYLGQFGSNYLAKGAGSLTDVSPAKNAGGKWAPILIVHGVRDARVPIDQARTLVSRLKSAGKKQGVDFDYIEQPKNTHNLQYNDVRVEWLEGAEKWLARFNPAYVESDKDKAPPIVMTVAPK